MKTEQTEPIEPITPNAQPYSGGMVAASNTFISYLVDSPMAKAFALKEGLMQ